MADYLSTLWAQNTHGVYDAAEAQIGYYVDLPTLATGHVMLFPGQALGDPWNWQIKASAFDLTFSQLVNAGQYLIQKGFSPAWMTPAEVQAMAAGSGPAGVPAGAEAVLQAPVTLATGAAAGAGQLMRGGLDWQRLALYGAGGLVGLLVLNKLLNKALA